MVLPSPFWGRSMSVGLSGGSLQGISISVSEWGRAISNLKYCSFVDNRKQGEQSNLKGKSIVHLPQRVLSVYKL